MKVAAVFQRLRGPVLADPVLAIGENATSPAQSGADPAAGFPTSSKATRSSVLGQYTRRATTRVHPPRELSRDAARIPVPPLGRPGDNAAMASSPGSGRAARSASWWTRFASREALRASCLSRPRRAPIRRPASSWTRSCGSRPSSAFSPNTRPSWPAKGPTSRRKDKVLSEAENLFRNRAIQTRSGLSSVNQDLNNQSQKSVIVREPAEQVPGCDNEQGRHRDRPAGLRPGFLQAARPLGG